MHHYVLQKNETKGQDINLTAWEIEIAENSNYNQLYKQSLKVLRSEKKVCIHARDVYIAKAINIAEDLKSRMQKVKQYIDIYSTDITDVWVPKDEYLNLDKLQVTVKIPSIKVTLLKVDDIDKQAIFKEDKLNREAFSLLKFEAEKLNSRRNNKSKPRDKTRNL